MKLHIAPRLAGLLLMGLLGWEGVAPLAARDTSQFKVGQPFPHIVLPSLENGQPASIADFRGKKLILHVFASW